MSSTLFDLEYLQKLTYERSKDWSSFLDIVVTNETLEEIDINEFDEIYDPDFESESNADLASMEDDGSDNKTNPIEFFRNASNATGMSLLLDNKTLSPGESKMNEENQLIDIYNQTLPIINEHNRQLKESGFDKILRSFDKKKIEDKVGSWLNRHNSLFGGDNTLMCADDKMNDYKTYRRPAERSCKNQIRSTGDASNDSDDSLQSGETARYIRSSRAGVIKNSATTTTVIKTFRKVKSNQEALREKCALRHVNRIPYDINYYNHYNLAQIQKSSNHKMQQLSLQRRRRKVLRKRTCDNSFSTMDSSSDSDYYYNDNRRCHTKYVKPCCSQHYRSETRYNNSQLSPTVTKKLKKTRHCATKMPLARGKRIYYYLHKSLSMSSSSTSYGSVCENRQAMKRNFKFCNDDRPCKRESECHCCSERKLCEDYKHIADSSNEWYVENCSPKKLPKASTSNLHKRRIVQTEKLSAVTEITHEDFKTVETSKSNSLKHEPIKIQITNEKTPKPKSEYSKTNTTLKDETLTDDDWEFQMALKASKESYEREQNSKLNKGKEVRNKMLPKPLRKTAKKQKESVNLKNTQNNKNNNIKKDDEVIEKFSKLFKDKNNEVDFVNLVDDKVMTKPATIPLPSKNSGKSESNTTKDTFLAFTSTEAMCNSTKLSSTSQASKKSFEKEQNTKLNKAKAITSNEKPITNTTEETFFSATPTQTICNSTALSSRSQAYNRQIADQFKIQANEEKSLKSKVNETKHGLEKRSLRSRKTKNDKQKYSDMCTEKKYTSSTVSEEKNLTQKVAAANTVTSTTLRSPKINSNSLTSTMQQNKEQNCSSDQNDCTLVTSTTNVELSLPKTVNEKVEDVQPHALNSNSRCQLPRKGILIYAPDDRNMASANSFSGDGYFTITKDHLSNVIGEKLAEKFLKYYIGCKRFNNNATIYYIPPTTATLNGYNDTTSSDSEDELENLGLYGDLYESHNKVI